MICWYLFCFTHCLAVQSPCGSYPSICPYWLDISSVQTGVNTSTAEAELLLSLGETGEPEITAFHRETVLLWLTLSSDTRHIWNAASQLSRRYSKELPLLHNAVGCSCEHSELSAFPRKLTESHLKQKSRAMKYFSTSWWLEPSQGISRATPALLTLFYSTLFLCTTKSLHQCLALFSQCKSFPVMPSLLDRQERQRTELTWSCMTT